MAKKFRKVPGRKPEKATGPDEGILPVGVDAEEEDDDESPEVDEKGTGPAPAPVARKAPTPSAPSGGAQRLSPVARAQEKELEVLLALMGGVMGGLSGFSQVPMTATEGSVSGAVAGALLGMMLGFDLGRTLFLSTRKQWAVWVALAGLTWVGLQVQGLWGGVVAVLAVTVFLVATWRENGDSSLPATRAPEPDPPK